MPTKPTTPDSDSAMERLIAAARACAEYLESVIEDVSEGDDCAWPEVDDGFWCSDLCESNGCAKSRSYQARAAIAAATEE